MFPVIILFEMLSVYSFGLYILCAIGILCTADPIIRGEPVGKIAIIESKILVINEKQYPFMVRLQIFESVPKKGEEDDEDACGGTLIGSQTILTAAHCLMEMHSKPKIEVIAGILHMRYEKNKAQTRLVEKYVIHQNYIDSCDGKNGKKRQHYCRNDIALLWVAKPFKFSPTLQPAVLASDISVAKNKVGVILGWGYTESGFDSDMLLKANHKVIPISECKKEYDDTIFDSGKLCLISGTKSSVFCFGDSGGPFVSNNVVYGLGSFGRKGGKRNLKNDCLPEDPSVYTNVGHYENWIKATIKNWSPKELKQFVRFEGKHSTGVFFDSIKPTLLPNVAGTHESPHAQRKDPHVQTKKPTKYPGNASKSPNIQQPKRKRN